MSQFVEEGHLGGYVPGGDEATYYPELWKWIVNYFLLDSKEKTILDVGCGDGVALEYFNAIGAKCVGVEGVEQNNDLICTHDYTKGRLDYHITPQSGVFDLIWCCEFVEHVEEQYVPNIMDTFSFAKTVLMTHAEPGQDGFHHVNLQPAYYWVAKLKEIGYNLDPETTLITRDLARYNHSPWNHYARSGLVFRRNT